MRVRYESAADLDRESSCAHRFSEAVGCRMVKQTGQYARMDYLAVDPSKKWHAWVEIKCRNARRGTYPTLMLSAAKWREGVNMADATGGNFVVVASYLDGDRAYIYDPSHLSGRKVWLEYGGRTAQQRDAGDVEAVMHIPQDLFVDV